MADGATIADLDTVVANGSHLFTAADPFTNEREAVLVPCDEPPGVRGWINCAVARSPLPHGATEGSE